MTAAQGPRGRQDYDVVIVHDWISAIAGSEHVSREIAQLFRQASILTLFADPQTPRVLGMRGRVAATGEHTRWSNEFGRPEDDYPG